MISLLSAVTGLPSPKSMSFLKQNSTSNHQRLSSQVGMETGSESALATPRLCVASLENLEEQQAPETRSPFDVARSHGEIIVTVLLKCLGLLGLLKPQITILTDQNHQTAADHSSSDGGLPPRLIVSHCFAWNLYNFLTFWCFIPLILILLANIWGLRTWLRRTGLSILTHRLCMEVWRATIHWRCAMCTHV